MNYPVTQYNELKNALIVFKNRYGLDKSDMITHAQRLHFKIYQQKNYKTENLNVILKENGERLFPMDQSFKLYPDKCNDQHINTALKNAINEIFN